MGMMKRYLEEVSIELGYDGEINDHVIDEAEKRMKEMSNKPAPRKD